MSVRCLLVHNAIEDFKRVGLLDESFFFTSYYDPSPSTPPSINPPPTFTHPLQLAVGYILFLFNGPARFLPSAIVFKLKSIVGKPALSGKEIKKEIL